jgi:cell division cycle 20-like protein 1 (cofactor of APC complex)
MSFSSPSKYSNYIGDRFIPNRNAENWEIQFYINDNENRTPLRRTRDINGCLTGPLRTPIGMEQQTQTATINNLNNPQTATITANTPVTNAVGTNGATTNANVNANTANGANNNNNNPIVNTATAAATAGTATTAAAVSSPSTPSTTAANIELSKDLNMYKAVLKNELLGTTIDGMTPSVLQPRKVTSVFQHSCPSFTSPFKSLDENSMYYSSAGSSLYNSHSHHHHHLPYSISPLSSYSQKLLRSPRKPMRKIPKVPFKVLDAPELQDDFYLNLVDWSSTNVLGVGLGTSVYLWSACTSQVTKLCDLANREDSVSSVSWSEKGNFIAVGTFKGDVQIWDAAASKLVNTLTGHTARVGALAWNHDLLCSGSRDRNVFLRDIRVPAYEGERKLAGHKQEVCGLKWSPDHLLLASGGNDNKLLVWNVNGGNTPIQTYNDHVAAVKAIAWSPHQHGLLASGGGTADRCIRFWNTLTGQNLQSMDTGSQVCNLAWSKHSNELVSTHGYSQNQILIWKYPSMIQLAKLTGHSYRVLYLAVSPDGEAIVTGAGDETLRFWNVFNKSRCTKVNKFQDLYKSNLF